jgi:hypothetical protein
MNNFNSKVDRLWSPQLSKKWTGTNSQCSNTKLCIKNHSSQWCYENNVSLNPTLTTIPVAARDPRMRVLFLVASVATGSTNIQKKTGYWNGQY